MIDCNCIFKDKSKVFLEIWRNRLIKFRDPHGGCWGGECDILKIEIVGKCLSQQFHDNKCLWDSLVLYYFGYRVILFQIFSNTKIQRINCPMQQIQNSRLIRKLSSLISEKVCFPKTKNLDISGNGCSILFYFFSQFSQATCENIYLAVLC